MHTLTPPHLAAARAVLARQPDGVLIGSSAAALWGLPVPKQNLQAVRIASPHGHGRLRAGVRQHAVELDERWVTRHDECRLAVPALAVLDVARYDGPAWGLAAADACLRLGLANADDFEAALVADPRRWGNEDVRRVLRLADRRAETAWESVSRLHMDAGRTESRGTPTTGLPGSRGTTAGRAGSRGPVTLPRPDLRRLVSLPDGSTALPAFCWPDYRLIGDRAHDDPARQRADFERDNALRAAGWWVMRWSWADAWNPAALARRIQGGLATVHMERPLWDRASGW